MAPVTADLYSNDGILGLRPANERRHNNLESALCKWKSLLDSW